MRAASSIWSRYVTRLFGTTPPRGRTRLRRAGLRRREHAPVYCAAQVMEERALLSATFDGALSIGNDAGLTAAFDVAADAAGNSYVTGAFSGTVDFDQSDSHVGDTDILTARGSHDAFVAKYAPDNSLIWVQRMGGDAIADAHLLNNGENDFTDTGSKIAVDGSGNVFVVGNFADSGDFGSTTLTSLAYDDGFVVKLDAGGTLQWARGLGTAGGTDHGGGVGVDSIGNVYAMVFDIGPFSGSHDIHKLSPTGTPIWSQTIATKGSSLSADMAVDASGNTFIAGTFGGTVDFDSGPKPVTVSSGAKVAGFVLKLKANGSFDWVTPFVGQTVGSTSGRANARSVALDGSGNVIVGGYYVDTVDFNPAKAVTTLPATGGGFIAKLNSSGGLTWARALEQSSVNGASVSGLAVDSAGSIYATGFFTGTIDLDPTAGTDVHTSAGDADIFVLKLTAAGSFSWAETFGGTGRDSGIGIAVDPTGGIHLVGAYADTVDFDPAPFATYNLTTPGTYRNAFRLRLRQV